MKKMINRVVLPLILGSTFLSAAPSAFAAPTDHLPAHAQAVGKHDDKSAVKMKKESIKLTKVITTTKTTVVTKAVTKTVVVTAPDGTKDVQVQTYNAPVEDNTSSSTATTETTVPTIVTTASSEKAANVLNSAKSLLGIPYVWGGMSLSGMDCSGYTGYVYAQNGIGLPRTAEQQQAYTTPTSNPQPGDLVFYGAPAYHVAIYAGDGMIFEAPHPGDVTKYTSMGNPPGFGTIINR